MGDDAPRPRAEFRRAVVGSSAPVSPAVAGLSVTSSGGGGHGKMGDVGSGLRWKLQRDVFGMLLWKVILGRGRLRNKVVGCLHGYHLFSCGSKKETKPNIQFQCHFAETDNSLFASFYIPNVLPSLQIYKRMLTFVEHGVLEMSEINH